MFKTVLTMLLAVVSAATCTPAPAADLGIHLGTYHTRHGVYNNANPGVYVRADNGLTAGVYLNSLSKVSTYAGWTTSTQAGPVELSLTLGGITGYPVAHVLPQCRHQGRRSHVAASDLDPPSPPEGGHPRLPRLDRDEVLIVTFHTKEEPCRTCPTTTPPALNSSTITPGSVNWPLVTVTSTPLSGRSWRMVTSPIA